VYCAQAAAASTKPLLLRKASSGAVLAQLAQGRPHTVPGYTLRNNCCAASCKSHAQLPPCTAATGPWHDSKSDLQVSNLQLPGTCSCRAAAFKCRCCHSMQHVRLAFRDAAWACPCLVQPGDPLAAWAAAYHLVKGLGAPAKPVRNSPAAHKHRAGPQHQFTAYQSSTATHHSWQLPGRKARSLVCLEVPCCYPGAQFTLSVSGTKSTGIIWNYATIHVVTVSIGKRLLNTKQRRAHHSWQLPGKMQV
jgi:hypothetical protein